MANARPADSQPDDLKNIIEVEIKYLKKTLSIHNIDNMLAHILVIQEQVNNVISHLHVSDSDFENTLVHDGGYLHTSFGSFADFPFQSTRKETLRTALNKVINLDIFSGEKLDINCVKQCAIAKPWLSILNNILVALGKTLSKDDILSLTPAFYFDHINTDNCIRLDSELVNVSCIATRIEFCEKIILYQHYKALLQEQHLTNHCSRLFYRNKASSHESNPPYIPKDIVDTCISPFLQTSKLEFLKLTSIVDYPLFLSPQMALIKSKCVKDYIPEAFMKIISGAGRFMRDIEPLCHTLQQAIAALPVNGKIDLLNLTCVLDTFKLEMSELFADSPKKVIELYPTFLKIFIDPINTILRFSDRENLEIKIEKNELRDYEKICKIITGRLTMIDTIVNEIHSVSARSAASAADPVPARTRRF